MTKEDLIPITTHDRAIELGRQGGLSKSKHKSIGAKLRHAKERGDIIGYMMKLAKTSDPLEAFTWLLENFAEQYELITKESNPDKQFWMRDKLLQRMADFIKLRYGETYRTVNIHTVAQFQDYLKQWREVREERSNNQQQPQENVKEETKEIPMKEENNVPQVTTITQEWDEVEPETEDEEEAVFTII